MGILVDVGHDARERVQCRGLNRSWAYHVDVDVALCKLDGEIPRERFDPCLGNP